MSVALLRHTLPAMVDRNLRVQNKPFLPAGVLLWCLSGRESLTNTHEVPRRDGVSAEMPDMEVLLERDVHLR